MEGQNTKNADKADKILKIMLCSVIGAALIPILAYGGYKAYERYQFNKLWEAQIEIAQKNAVEYVRDKYSLDAEVVSVQWDKWKDSIWADEYIELDNTSVKVTAGNKEFCVYVDWQKESADGYDTYQYDEIRNALENKIQASFPDCEIVGLYLNREDCIGFDSEYPGLYTAKDEYFDENDLDSILHGCKGNTSIYCYDTVFDDCELFEFLKTNNISAELFSFDSKDRLVEFIYQKTGYYTYDTRCALYAPYITDYRKIKDNEDIHRDYGVKTYDEIMYRYYPTQGEKNKYTCDDITMTHSENTAANYKIREIDHYLSDPVTKGYGMEKTFGEVYIYYPLEKLEGREIKNLGAAWFDFGSGLYDMSRPIVVDDYAIFVLSGYADTFIIVDTTGMEPFIPNYTVR